ncbi:hypothetical protein BUPH_06809 [Paraburkholderia phenoliruptrix BR3459a]|uniref:Uncharacterized protein n=1 Tax=Paraburkholderia phenoliruptrix BR3459a TaxID=1229205 RepID=K0DJ62_9BURK|nr:hypothetical protein BUPH_06809 [Paraburkholderia phenoliruptrix BR3459a]
MSVTPAASHTRVPAGRPITPHASAAARNVRNDNTQRGRVGRALDTYACDADANLNHARDDGLGVALRLNGQGSRVLNWAFFVSYFYR